MGYLRDMNIENLGKPGSCVHWPVGQVPCDGRTGLTADRATSFLGFPITNPVIHEGSGSRSWVNSLYGMTDRPFDEILPLARSWAKAPALKVISGGVEINGYDPGQRAYVLKSVTPGKAGRIELEMAATADSPVSNFCLLVRDWGDDDVSLLLDGKPLKKDDGFRRGVLPTMSGTDLVVWVEARSSRPLRVTLVPSGPAK
jgi:hypothetical protein